MVNDCGMLVGSSGLLNDGNCSAPMMFVCETTKKGENRGHSGHFEHHGLSLVSGIGIQ